jgi:spermidine/putrescine transport system permease protein
MSSVRARAWLLIGPAVAWTVLFFILPLAAMVVVSLQDHANGGWTLANYRQFFTDPNYSQAMVNSLEVTA